jgi:hypothetical protein
MRQLLAKYTVIIVGLIAIVGLASAVLEPNSYSEDFSSNAGTGGNYDYKAGEDTVTIGGDLPAQNERLVIESGGIEEGWKNIPELELKIAGQTFQPGGGGFGYDYTKDGFYAYQPDRPGLYDMRVNLNISARRIQGEFGENASIDAGISITKDDKGFCGNGIPRNTEKCHISYSPLYGTAEVYKWAKEDVVAPDTEVFPDEPRWNYNDQNGENSKSLYKGSVSAPENLGSNFKEVEITKSFRIYNQDVDPIKPGEQPGTCKERLGSGEWHNYDEWVSVSCNTSESPPHVSRGSWDGTVDDRIAERGDDLDDTVLESIILDYKPAKCGIYDTNAYDEVDGCRKVVSPIYNFKSFELNYIDPMGSTLVQVGERKFTGNTQTTSDYPRTTVDAGDNSWKTTGIKFSVDLKGEFEEMGFDDPKRMILKGDYLADSPSGSYPEGYRWVDAGNHSENLTHYNSINSSKGPYVEKESDIDLESTDVEGGTYELLVKSSADNYPVDVGMRDFSVKTDQYLRYQDTETFYPQLDPGTNTLEIYTSNSNEVSYDLTWDECHDPIVGLEPGNNSYVQTTSPTLNATTGCPDLTNVTFRDARTDSIIQEYENVGNNEPLSAETDLSIGETYEWYIRACDQGVCHDTGTYTFTIGENPSTSSSDSSVTEEEITTKGLDTVIRDEDFNPFGKNNSVGTPLSKGYINKLEEESDQLEDGMSTDTLQSYKDRIWVNSDGSNDSADQYAITKYRDWSISNRGKPYPPWNTYYRDTDNKRNTIDDSTVLKTQKVFANSLAVVAARDVNKNGELIAQEGAGVWIDPDDIRWTKTRGKYEYPGQWDELLRFKMDITGPDSGLGYDNNQTTREYSQGRKVVQTDIHWKQES